MKLDGLNTKCIGRELKHYKEIDSTQLEAWRNEDLKSGTIVFADIQTSGIGTHGRVWNKSCKKDISFSIKINTNCNIDKLENLTYVIAEIIVEIFFDLCKISLKIKKPNDLILNNKKIGGILTQTKLNGEKVKEIVIGIGINLGKQRFSEELKEIATSIENEFEVKTDREKIVTEFCNRFEQELIKREIIKRV